MNDKTISVSPGHGVLQREIKKMLREEGWTLKVQKGPNIAKGELNSSDGVSISQTYKTKYLLYVYARSFDLCFDFSKAINYEVVVVDVDSSEEVISMGGKGCEKKVAKDFMKLVNGEVVK